MSYTGEDQWLRIFMLWSGISCLEAVEAAPILKEYPEYSSGGNYGFGYDFADVLVEPNS